MVILVAFQGGGTAELSAAQLEAKVRIDYPVDDVILGRSMDDHYTYTVTVIRAEGPHEEDEQPHRQNSSTFFVNVIK